MSEGMVFRGYPLAINEIRQDMLYCHLSDSLAKYKCLQTGGRDHRNGLPCYFHIGFGTTAGRAGSLCRGTLGTALAAFAIQKQKKPFEARSLTRFEWFELACEVARDAHGEVQPRQKGSAMTVAFGMRERHYITTRERHHNSMVSSVGGCSARDGSISSSHSVRRRRHQHRTWVHRASAAACASFD